jgi:hypothetical protein
VDGREWRKATECDKSGLGRIEGLEEMVVQTVTTKECVGGCERDCCGQRGTDTPYTYERCSSDIFLHPLMTRTRRRKPANLWWWALLCLVQSPAVAGGNHMRAHHGAAAQQQRRDHG